MKRATLIITAALATVAVAVSAAVFTGSAGASDPYRPGLSAAGSAAVKVAEGQAAAYTVSAAKSVAKVAAARSAKRLAAKPVAKKAVAKATSTSELARAKSILAGLIAKHPILKGTTVEIGNAQGYQAVAYYRSGRIVISRSHRASLERILSHEVWHVIDYRDNGRIDWGENVPR